MASITTKALVRTDGALLTDEAIPSYIKDPQLDAAIQLAQATLISAVTLEIYNTVLNWTSGELLADPAKATKKLAFQRAESYFTIARLPQVVQNLEITPGGIVKRSKQGESETEFRSLEEGQRSRRDWEGDAFKQLAPYLTVISKDTNGADLGIRVPGSFSIMAI